MKQTATLGMATVLTGLAFGTVAGADTLTVEGYVTAPTGPDSSPTAYGYDNGGYFGTQCSPAWAVFRLP
jgi:hypothetical protein